MDPRDESFGTLPNRRRFLAEAAAIATGIAGAACIGARGTGADLDSSVAPGTTARGPRDDAARVLRLPSRMRKDVRGRISPFVYAGGFDTKTALYETIVRMGPDGRLAPGIAEAWSIEDGGTTHVFRLRAGATFHDGSPLDAEAVRLHFRRWVGLPEHSWLESNERIASVEALGATELRIRTDRPCALLPDLLAINPCSITAPSCFDDHGEWVRPIGSGPLRFVEAQDEGRRMRCTPFASGAVHAAGATYVDFIAYTGDDVRRPIDDLLDGTLDAVVDTWSENVPRERVAAVQGDARFDVTWGPGGLVTFLAFRRGSGPTEDLLVRQRIADAIDRDVLVRHAELGHADPCAAWAPSTVRDWPASSPRGPHSSAPSREPRLRFPRAQGSPAEEPREARLHALLADQVRRAGFEVELSVHASAEFQALLARGEYDLLVLRTLGVPYDPVLSLSRFLPPKRRASASSSLRLLGDAELTALVAELATRAEESERAAQFERIQQHLDRALPVVPLYVPRGLAIVRRGLARPALDHDLYHLDLGPVLASI
ncbi:MAG: ABC transporter substrate-binding protein [Planctomycetes bacterium]|nr:ABC transporter substrate-binding protein [Planctomycetota bacterium]